MSIAVLMLLMSFIPGLLNTRSYTGKAYDLDAGQKLYREEHEELYKDGRRIVLKSFYRDQDSNVIATRTVDFSRDPFMPDFRLEDQRSGYMEGAEIIDGKLRLYVRRLAGQPIEEKLITVPGPAVVDAGFNNFVQSHWDSLMNGELLYMNFGVPSELDYYGFRLYKDEEVMTEGRTAVVVKCDFDNFILRLFVRPIVLKYDIGSKRMVSYEGISNINNESGKSHSVKILFQPFGP